MRTGIELLQAARREVKSPELKAEIEGYLDVASPGWELRERTPPRPQPPEKQEL